MKEVVFNSNLNSFNLNHLFLLDYLNQVQFSYCTKIFFFKINNLNADYNNIKLYCPFLFNNCLKNYIYNYSYINFDNFTIINSYQSNNNFFELIYKCKLNRSYFYNPEVIDVLRNIETPRKYRQYHIINNQIFNLKNYSNFNSMYESHIVTDNETKNCLTEIFKRRHIEI